MYQKKQVKRSVFLVVLAVLTALPAAYAGHGKYGQGGHSGGFEGVLFMKAHTILEHQEELGLSEEKVQAIKDLKMAAKKKLIQQEAEIEILSLDIRSKMREYPLDAEAVNTLVAKKYDLKKAKAQSLVSSLAELKSMLSADQYDQLKAVWKEKKHSRYGDER